jgi:hypothetical protein
MQDGCKVYMDCYMASNGSWFMVTWIIFQKPSFGGRPNTKPLGDHGIPNARDHRFIPLHTQAKSCDYEIVRGQKKVSQGRPNTPPQSCSVVTYPQVECEGICNWALNQMLFQ